MLQYEKPGYLVTPDSTRTDDFTRKYDVELVDPDPRRKRPVTESVVFTTLSVYTSVFGYTIPGVLDGTFNNRTHYLEERQLNLLSYPELGPTILIVFCNLVDKQNKLSS